MKQATFFVMLAMTAIFCAVTPPVSASRHPPHCEGAKEPDFSAFTNNLQESFWQQEPTRSTLGYTPNVPEEFLNIKRSYLTGQRGCHHWRRNPLEYGGTLCPTYHIFNYDENRYPRTLVESRCSCRSCLRHPDTSQGMASVLQCQPIFHYTPVHRRVNCTDGVFQYREVWEPLVVACTCSLPSLELE